LGKNTLFIGFGVNHPAGGLLGFDDSTGSGSGNGNGSNGNGGFTNGDTTTVTGTLNGNGTHVEVAIPINGNGNGNGNGDHRGNGSHVGSDDARQRKIPTVVGVRFKRLPLPFRPIVSRCGFSSLRTWDSIRLSSSATSTTR
jgi:hypothetical protein